jgi:hypothetical protein
MPHLSSVIFVDFRRRTGRTIDAATERMKHHFVPASFCVPSLASSFPNRSRSLPSAALSQHQTKNYSSVEKHECSLQLLCTQALRYRNYWVSTVCDRLLFLSLVAAHGVMQQAQEDEHGRIGAKNAMP